MYKVLAYFTDLQDNNHPYKAGDQFPRKGLEVSEKRIEELSTGTNRRGVPLIKLVEEAPAKAEVEEKKPEVEVETEVETEVKTEVKTEVETEEKPKRRNRKNKE